MGYRIKCSYDKLKLIQAPAIDPKAPHGSEEIAGDLFNIFINNLHDGFFSLDQICKTKPMIINGNIVTDGTDAFELGFRVTNPKECIMYIENIMYQYMQFSPKFEFVARSKRISINSLNPNEYDYWLISAMPEGYSCESMPGEDPTAITLTFSNVLINSIVEPNILSEVQALLN